MTFGDMKNLALWRMRQRGVNFGAGQGPNSLTTDQNPDYVLGLLLNQGYAEFIQRTSGAGVDPIKLPFYTTQGQIAFPLRPLPPYGAVVNPCALTVLEGTYTTTTGNNSGYEYEFALVNTQKFKDLAGDYTRRLSWFGPRIQYATRMYNRPQLDFVPGIATTGDVVNLTIIPDVALTGTTVPCAQGGIMVQTTDVPLIQPQYQMALVEYVVMNAGDAVDMGSKIAAAEKKWTQYIFDAIGDDAVRTAARRRRSRTYSSSRFFVSKVAKVPDRDRTVRVTIDDLRAGWMTSSFPHAIPDNALYQADNVVFNRDGIVSKRPGNIAFGNVSGAIGTGVASKAGYRWYPPAGPMLVAHSSTGLYRVDPGSVAGPVVTGLTATRGAFFAQMRDADFSGGGGTAICLFITDGVSIPKVYNGNTFANVSTAGGFLPTNHNTGNPITPKYCLDWGNYMVYAGDPNDPTGVWFSDVGLPERFTGFGNAGTNGTYYTAYYPDSADGTLGVITGIYKINANLVITFSAGVVRCINTGTYGATQFQFTVISTTTGMPAERSFAAFEGYGLFFGGDRFYATDSNSVVPLPDNIPSVYSGTSASAFPCEIQNTTSLSAFRYGNQYICGYDNTGNGLNNSVVVFDVSANGGWTYGQSDAYGQVIGGAWSRFPTGMPIAWGLECRGPGDSRQVYWGSSALDLVAQYDRGYADFGQPITMEIRAKSFFLDEPINPKTVTAIYTLGAFPTQTTGAYTDAVTSYVVLDEAIAAAPSIPVTITPGAIYGEVQYGQAQYGTILVIEQLTARSQPATTARGYSLQPGCSESSINPCNVLGFVMEVIVDQPEAGGSMFA